MNRLQNKYNLYEQMHSINKNINIAQKEKERKRKKESIYIPFIGK